MPWIAAGAGLLLGLSMVMLSIFFATEDSRFDRVAEWSFVGFGILAIVTIASVAGRLTATGALVPVMSAVGIAGAAIVGLAELGTTLGLVDFRRVATLVTLGFVAFLAWIGAVSIVVVTGGGGGLDPGLGWLGIVAILVGLGIIGLLVRQPGAITGEQPPSRLVMASFLVPMLALVAWMIWLGAGLAG